MTVDVRQQLSDALDEAEKIAKAAIQGPWRTGAGSAYLVDYIIYGRSPVSVGRLVQVANMEAAWEQEANAAHIVRWDPATVLRLVKRDRELLRFLASWEEITGEPLDREQGLAAEVTVETLKRTVDLAAEFWLGTQEADGG